MKMQKMELDRLRSILQLYVKTDFKFYATKINRNINRCSAPDDT